MGGLESRDQRIVQRVLLCRVTAIAIGTPERHGGILGEGGKGGKQGDCSGGPAERGTTVLRKKHGFLLRTGRSSARLNSFKTEVIELSTGLIMAGFAIFCSLAKISRSTNRRVSWKETRHM